MANSDNHLQLSPTTAYYLRKLLRQNLDCLEWIVNQPPGITVDPLTDFNGTLELIYSESPKINSAVQELERLAKYHQVLAGQGSLHRQELAKTELSIFSALGFKQKTVEGNAKASILIIDDRPENIRLLSVALNRQGYHVESLDKSTMALNTTRDLRPDLILLDVMMPNIDGYEVCQQLKADEQTRDIPIIFVSAVTNVTDKVKGFRVGAVDYITKPFQFDEVLARVEHQLKIQNLRQRLEDQNVRLQKEIRQRQAEYQQLLILKAALEQMSNYYLFFNEQGGFIFVSETSMQYLGYDRDELLQMNFSQIDPEFTPEVWQQHWQYLAQTGYVDLQTQHHTKSGDPVTVNLYFSYVNVTHKPCGYVAVQIAQPLEF